jgi:hypothetical protein
MHIKSSDASIACCRHGSSTPLSSRDDALPALGTKLNSNDERHRGWIVQPEVLLYRPREPHLIKGDDGGEKIGAGGRASLQARTDTANRGAIVPVAVTGGDIAGQGEKKQ